MAPALAALSREDRLAALRGQVRLLERSSWTSHLERSEARSQPVSSSIDRLAEAPGPTSGWHLGASPIDALIGPGGLEPAACHEIKSSENGAGARAAQHGFALALAARRLRHLEQSEPGIRRRILYCSTGHAGRDLGHLHTAGLARYGLSPRDLLIVETARTSEILWVLEEGLRSGALALVLAPLEEIALTPARRLALAAEAQGTPCLLLTAGSSPPAGAMASRWRIGPAAGAPHPFDPCAPGPARLAVTLERCRSAPPLEHVEMSLEWLDEALRFRLASALADRADAPFRPQLRTA